MRLWLLVLLALPALAQDPGYYYWISPGGDTNLQGSRKGEVRLAPWAQVESQCWRFTPVQGGFRLSCAAFPNFPVGKVWKVSPEGDFHVLTCDGRKLELGGFSLWRLWARRRVTAPPPEAGNYLRNDGRWRVVVATLVGRAEPKPGARVVRRFKRGQLLTPDLGRGGADEVLWNIPDDQGNTWMKLPGCWVRANSRYIQPAP